MTETMTSTALLLAETLYLQQNLEKFMTQTDIPSKMRTAYHIFSYVAQRTHLITEGLRPVLTRKIPELRLQLLHAIQDTITQSEHATEVQRTELLEKGKDLSYLATMIEREFQQVEEFLRTKHM